MKIVYKATSPLKHHSSETETIELIAEIDNIEDYDATLEMLRAKVLSSINYKEQHDQLVEKYQDARQKFLDLTQKLESAHKQWVLIQNFLKAQGLKSDTEEFPSEALTSLSKSLPPITGEIIDRD